jgi:hypothetical protein
MLRYCNITVLLYGFSAPGPAAPSQRNCIVRHRKDSGGVSSQTRDFIGQYRLFLSGERRTCARMLPPGSTAERSAHQDPADRGFPGLDRDQPGAWRISANPFYPGRAAVRVEQFEGTQHSSLDPHLVARLQPQRLCDALLHPDLAVIERKQAFAGS